MLTERVPPTSSLIASGPAIRCPQACADPGSADAVANALLDYLGSHLGMPGLDYSAPPTAVGDGWETFLYTFSLKGPIRRPEWGRPLVLRIHANSCGLERARHEFEVPRHLAGLGYPVAQPVHLEEDCDLFGGPFLILEQVSGPTLLRAMLDQPLNLLHFSTQMAEVHARLHTLAATGFPTPPGPFLDRQLTALEGIISRHELTGLASGLSWLQAHRPADPAIPSILHLDFHPLNLIEHEGSLTVLDWTYADVGDAHADLAMSLLILECAPTPDAGLWERLAALIGRPVSAGWYHHVYARQRPVDESILSYYRAWAALCRLARYGGWLRAGPELSDCKSAALEHVGTDLLDAFRGYFHRWSGVEVKL